MDIISSFLEFCFIGIFLLQVLILWCLWSVSSQLDEMQKRVDSWWYK